MVLGCALLAPMARATTATVSTLTGAKSVRGSFLARGMGARAIALGESYAAVSDDASAASWNPGGLGQVDGLNVVAMYDNLGAEVGERYLAGALPTGPGVAGVSLTTMNYGEYDEFNPVTGQKTGTKSLMDVSGTFAYAQAHPAWLKPGGWSGVALDVVQETVGGVIWGVNVGSVLPLTPTFTAGWALQHLGPKSQGASLPSALRVGGAYEATEGVAIVSDVAYGLATKQSAVAAGVEYAPHARVALRAGYKWQTVQATGGLRGFTAGLGARVGGVAIDYAYEPVGDFTTSHRVAMVFGGGK